MTVPSETRPAPLFALAGGCAAGVAIAYVGFVQTYEGERADEAALAGRGAARESGVELAQTLLTSISVGTLLLAIAVLVVQALVRGRVGLSVIAATVIIGSILTTELLKDVILARPELVSSPLEQNSFPSGHTTVAFGIGVAATLAVPPSMRSRVALLAVAYGSAIGIATVAAGWHRPSDALGAYLVTVAWAAGTVGAAAWLGRSQLGDESKWPRLGSAIAYVVAAGAVLVIAFALVAVAALADLAGIADFSRVGAAFVAACAGLLASAAVLMGGLLAALAASASADRPA